MVVPPFFKILDVILLRRERWKMRTVNKFCFVLSCRLSGESLFFSDGRTLRAGKGDILYIPRGSSYRQETPGEEVIAVHLETYSAMPDRIAVFSPEDPQLVCALFEKCHRAFIDAEKNGGCLCMAAVYEILAHTRLFANDSSGQPAYDRAAQYLEAHLYDTGFSIENMCREADISRPYFTRLFKERTGTTPLAYVNEKRIDKAGHLLETGSYTNEEIASLCGFSDVKYFYVVFKKITGQTTRGYVQKNARSKVESTDAENK